MNVRSKRRRDETNMDLLIFQQEVKDTKVFPDKTARRKLLSRESARTEEKEAELTSGGRGGRKNLSPR